MKKQKPLIVVNFKTYKSGKEALKLAKIIEKVDKKIIIGVQATDLYLIAKNTKLTVFCQHCDYFNIGRNTGYILPEAIIASGGAGVFLNHSEHKLNFEILDKTIRRCREIGLKTVVFASDLEETKRVETLGADFIAVEPPELVAGNVSVSSASPQLISDVAKNIKSRFLVGAGIHNFDDVEKSLELGASGIAVSSAITTAENPGKVLKELISGK